ncbi:MAG TPA: alpha/beta fold hydrolase, partial [Ideonella sp.]|nr:alpha/beta fold hydrolase [Ideonella sp.]
RPLAALATLVPLAAACALAGLAPAAASAAPEPTPLLKPCRLKGVEYEARCGVLKRPLDPAQPAGHQIDLHFAVLPAIARNKKPDPVFFFAGGPGQSAIELAGQISAMLGRFNNRRDLVLIDQRGTGRSAPLACDSEPATQPLRDAADPARQAQQLQACREKLVKLPYGDLRQFTTPIAMADADAVRAALGAERINALGGSYGTRAVLEYMRQFPQHVRRAVIDGVAPPDMALPASFSPDAQAAFDALLGDCEKDPGCAKRYPALRAQWQTLLAGLPREVTVPHPVTGQEERFTLTRDMLVGLMRLPLYVPALSSALPFAISETAAGRFTPLMGVSSVMMGGAKGMELAMGMHFSVVCAEDMPRLAASADRPGADFGEAAAQVYRSACAQWPRGAVPAAFYTLPPAPAATLVLSGSIDPVTPPRHGEHVAKALGAKAAHVVVPNAGHGTMALGCMRDVVYRFVDNDDEAAALAALKTDAACASRIPRPLAYQPVTTPHR